MGYLFYVYRACYSNFVLQNHLSMPRGTVKIYKNIFNEIDPKRRVSRGRSRNLLMERNKCLIARYYFYGHFCQNGYGDIIERLSHEFYLSTVTITELITENMDVLDKLKDEQPELRFFKERWPHLKW